MADTIHRDPFELLIRKIGYSVGLEDTLSRMRDLAREYGDTSTITSGQWHRLVHERWGLKTEHIADVFAELDLVRRRNRVVDVLPALDALGILARRLTSDQFDVASQYVLLHQVLVGDGDIFLNCLAADFEKDRCSQLLVAMVKHKRELAYQLFMAPVLRERLDRIITIETQKGNKGGAGAGAGVEGLRRTTPLNTRHGPLERDTSSEVSISADYLRKVPPRRRDWAESVGLFDSRMGITQRGSDLLAVLDGAGYRTPSGAFVLWPFRSDLQRLHLTPKGVPWSSIDSFEFMQLVRTGWGYRHGNRPWDDNVGEETVRDLGEIYAVYRGLNPQKSILRNELPIRIASLVMTAATCARGEPMLPIKETLNAELHSERRRVEFRTSKLHEGSLIVRAH